MLLGVRCDFCFIGKGVMGGVLDVICVSLERVLLAVRCDLCFIGKGVTGCQM